MALVTNFIENKLKVVQPFEKFHVQALFANNYNKSLNKAKLKKGIFPLEFLFEVKYLNSHHVR